MTRAEEFLKPVAQGFLICAAIVGIGYLIAKAAYNEGRRSGMLAVEIQNAPLLIVQTEKGWTCSDGKGHRWEARKIAGGAACLTTEKGSYP